MKLTTERDDPAKPERATKVRLRMEPFDLPLLCALAFAALFWCGVWGPAWLTPPMQLWLYGLAALTAATVVTVIRAVDGRIRGSRAKRVAHWIIAIPTAVATILLALLTSLASGAEDDFGFFLTLAMLSLLGGIACGLAAMLVIAFLPSKRADAR